MERWNESLHTNAENPKVDAFLQEIAEVCKRHDMSIGHEDGHGAFIVEPYCPGNIEWLMCAHDDTRST